MKNTTNPNEFEAQTETTNEVSPDVQEALGYMESYREMERDNRSYSDALNSDERW